MVMLVAVVREYPVLLHLMLSMALFAMGAVVAILSAVDVTVDALCPGSDQCPEAVFLSTVKSVVGGSSGILLAPMLGSLSDMYGRKPFLVASTSIMALPFVILVVSRSRTAIYCFFAAETLSAAVGGGGASWLTFFLAYVADIVPDREGLRLGAFGAVSGVTMVGFVLGPLLARQIPEAYSFQVASVLCLGAALYMLLLVPESKPQYKLLLRRLRFPSFRLLASAPAPAPEPGESREPPSAPQEPVAPGQGQVQVLMEAPAEQGPSLQEKEKEKGQQIGQKGEAVDESTSLLPSPASSSASRAPGRGPGPHLMRNRSAMREAVSLFSSSRALGMLMLVAFVHSLSDYGQTNNMFYVFKAKFHWSKDNFSIYTAGIGGFAVLSQLVVLPLVAPLIPVRPLLLIALCVSALHTALYGLAWAEWVVYLALSCSTVVALIGPSISSCVARIAGPEEQGKLQGVSAGVTSLAGVLAPLIINPITALFLSDSAPFDCKGFGIFVASLFDVTAFCILLFIPWEPERTRLQVIAEEVDAEGAIRPEATAELLTTGLLTSVAENERILS